MIGLGLASGQAIHFSVPLEIPRMTDTLPPWAQRRQRVMDWRVGAVAIPVGELLGVAPGYFVASRNLDTDLLVIIGVTVLVTLVCAAVEQRIQELRTVGRAALVATFLPSALW